MSIYMKNLKYYCGECDAEIYDAMNDAVEDHQEEDRDGYYSDKREDKNAPVIIFVTCPACKFLHEDVEYDTGNDEFCYVPRRFDKYLWVTTEQRSGEYEFGPLHHLYGMSATANEEQLLREHFKYFWGEGTYQVEKTDWDYYCPSGEVAIRVKCWTNFTEDQAQCAKKIGFYVTELR